MADAARGEGPVRWRRRNELGVTSGTLGSTAAQTVMVAVFPILLAEYAQSAFRVGLVVAGEGAFALLVPYWVGRLSDRLPPSLARRYGRRALFIVGSAPIMAAAIAIAPFVPGYWRLTGVAFVFFAALHVYLTPLWALMIDTVPSSRWGRVQGYRGVFHAGGLAYGLIAGGLLYSLWPPAPFLVAAALVLATTAVTWMSIRRHPSEREVPAAPTTKPASALREKPEARWFLAGNALWTGSVDGLRPYFFLFATIVVGISVAEASLLLILLVVGLGAGSALLGGLGDRANRGRLLQYGLVATGIAMVAGVAVREPMSAFLLLLIAGAGAAAVITLPFPVYAELVGVEAMGRSTSFYVISLGAGRLIAPILVGAAIDLGSAWFPAERGYPLMWPVAGAMMLAGAFALHRALESSAPRVERLRGARPGSVGA